MREHEELLAEHKAVKAAAKFRENIGRPLAELAPRQARRKRAEFKSKAAAALWFAKSFGIEIKSLEAVDDNNEKVVFCYDDKEDDDDRAVQANPSQARSWRGFRVARKPLCADLFFSLPLQGVP